MKQFRYLLEYLVAQVFFAIFSILPYRFASNLGGWLAKKVFPHTKRTLIARKNITLALPELSSKEIDKIIISIWDNLGRNFAELPHISNLTNEKLWEIACITGEENINTHRHGNQGALFFTAHIGNWEIAPKVFSALGHPVNIVYRRANNPGLERMIQNARSSYVINTLPKGSGGSRAIVDQIKKGNNVGMLVDQKMNDGIEIDFFAQKAMTAPAIARLAIKYQRPIIPVRVCRQNNTEFKVTIFPELEIPNTNNKDNDIIIIMNRINQMLEAWIRETPGQWIWMHNRWP